jgi:hypothetical protein
MEGAASSPEGEPTTAGTRARRRNNPDRPTGNLRRPSGATQPARCGYVRSSMHNRAPHQQRQPCMGPHTDHLVLLGVCLAGWKASAAVISCADRHVESNSSISGRSAEEWPDPHLRRISRAHYRRSGRQSAPTRAAIGAVTAAQRSRQRRRATCRVRACFQAQRHSRDAARACPTSLATKTGASIPMPRTRPCRDHCMHPARNPAYRAGVYRSYEPSSPP